MVLLLLSAAAQHVCGQDGEAPASSTSERSEEGLSDRESDEVRAVRAWTARTVGEMDIRAKKGEQATPVRLRPSEKPLLKWSTPKVGRVYGDVYVWSEGGRPRALAAMFQWFEPHEVRTLEWSSLTDRSLRADLDGRELWRTGPADVAWSPVPDAGTPHRTAAGRVVQMRALARRFAVRTFDDRVGRTGAEERLRMLPSPLHRYESPEEGVVDGEIFAFVLGSDPEVFLSIEARNDGDGGTWHAMAARMNTIEMIVERDGEELVLFEKIAPKDYWDHGRPYCLKHVTPGGGS